MSVHRLRCHRGEAVQPTESAVCARSAGGQRGPSVLPHLLEQVKHRQPARIREHLHRIQRRIRPTVLDPAQIRLREAAMLAKLGLVQARCPAQFAYAFAELLGKCLFLHPKNLVFMI